MIPRIRRGLLVLMVAVPFFGFAGLAEATTVCLTPVAPILGPAFGDICIPLPD